MTRSHSVTVVIPSWRDMDAAMATARALARQVLPSGNAVRIVVVAQDWPSEWNAPERPGEVQVVHLPRAVGRSAARNAGAAHAAGDLLVFVDSDCRPGAESYLARLAGRFDDPGVVAAGGPLVAHHPFWGRYQADVERRRARSARDGTPTLSAANLAVRRGVFEACGGFDEGYRGYGFEDRDLVLRLARHGEVVREAGAVLRHEARLALPDIAAKLFEAGATTSRRFAQSHPDEYRASGYAAIDARRHGWLRVPGRLLGPLAMRAARPLGWAVQQRWMPYVAARTLVKATSAAAFLYGTARRQPASRSA